VSGIEWTDRTWNPVTGCTKVSPGCDHCYAATFAERWRGTPGHPYEQGFDLTLRPERLLTPLRWRLPSHVFVNSMSDLLHEAVPDHYVARVFAVMGLASRHTFQVLTKRHGRLRNLFGRPGFRDQVAEAATDIIGGTGRIRFDMNGWTPQYRTGPPRTVRRWVPPWPLPNVWLGVSVEDQRWAGIRVPALLAVPAAVRFVSAEPLLGPVDLSAWLRPVPGCAHISPEDGLCAHPTAVTPECHRFCDCPVAPEQWHGLDWVIVGGESGPGARAMDPDWAADLVTHCEMVSVPVFVKQLGTVWARHHGGPVKGGDPRLWPSHLRVRQLPQPTRAGRAAAELLSGAPA
jgi:protein gp37